jgi:protein-S-isoprenylcysteine O-methyltransferase Ste14
MTSITPSQRDAPGVIAPPPLIFLGFLLIGIAWDCLAGSALAVGTWRSAAGGILCLAAAAFLVPALGLFRKAGTRAEPWKPTTAIVTGGIYALTRNPMYVGMALAYAGLALLASSLAALLLLPLALLMMQFGVILREEAYLSAKFGSEYLRYQARVRRWL